MTSFVDVSVPCATGAFDAGCFFAQGVSGLVPFVFLAHGFQSPAAQYYVSSRHLARFGFAVCVPEYVASPISPNHARNAAELSALMDWAVTAAGPLSDWVDGDRIGAAGHSLGGKLSVLTASMDDRVKVVLGLDPVDASNFCNEIKCPDATQRLPLPIPTTFLGELTDAAGGLQPCAPVEANFTTFFAAAGAPSLQVTIVGAKHRSFLDDPDSCGLVCSFCQPASLAHEEVSVAVRAYLVSFFLRYLYDDDRYDDYLTGAAAQQRYVQTGIAQIEWK